MAVHFQVHSHLLLAISMLVLKGSKFSNKKKDFSGKAKITQESHSVAPNSNISLFALQIIGLTAPTWHIQKLNKIYSNEKSYTIKREIN